MKRIAKYRMPLLLTLFAGVVLASGAVLAQADAVATEVECDEVPADAEDAVEPVDPECLRCGGSTVAAPGGPIVKTSTISGDDCQTQVDAAADAACRAAGKPGDCAGHCAGGGNCEDSGDGGNVITSRTSSVSWTCRTSNAQCFCECR